MWGFRKCLSVWLGWWRCSGRLVEIGKRGEKEGVRGYRMRITPLHPLALTLNSSPISSAKLPPYTNNSRTPNSASTSNRSQPRTICSTTTGSRKSTSPWTSNSTSSSTKTHKSSKSTTSKCESSPATNPPRTNTKIAAQKSSGLISISSVTRWVSSIAIRPLS